MKKIIFTLILITAGQGIACAPYFPSSYLSHYDGYFAEQINLGEELKLIAEEYGYLDYLPFPQGYETSSAAADERDFFSAAFHQGGSEHEKNYNAYARAVRAGDTNAVPPDVPEHLREFTLYLEGVQEFNADPNVVCPTAWVSLLELDYSNRLHRTTWTHFMLGNLAGSHGMPEEASRHYEACRETSVKTKQDYSLGLAHASFKNDYLAQTNLIKRLEKGIKAVGYYHQCWDANREKHCLEHLMLDVQKAVGSDLEIDDMAIMEAMALFSIGDDSFIKKMKSFPELKITSRLAWFMYKSGRIKEAEAYLKQCPEDDTLANWLRFRVLQRAGRQNEALTHLRKWIKGLTSSKRVIFEFNYDGKVSNESALQGSMGVLYATQGQMMDALICFVNAGAYQDAALIAERYMNTDELKRYVDTFEFRAPYHSLASFKVPLDVETYQPDIQLGLSYLLARRLFREGRIEEALPYYPPEIVEILNDYVEAIKRSKSIWSGPNTRAAHLYHAARIMRWKGMELCGTELYPDYTIVNGRFPGIGMGDGDWLISTNSIPAYEESAPVPKLRFHYRHIAAELAGRSAGVTWDRHQKAMILWTAGSWIEKKYPIPADVHYKKLARIRFDALAEAADKKRWFPESTPMMDFVYRSETYIEPKVIARAAREYNK